jgi:ferritin-like metal-binding protein YciE
MAQTKTKSSAASNKGSKTASSGKSKTSGNTSNGSSSSREGESTMLEELFLDELKDIYWAEKHLVKALPKMEKAATSEELKQAFADHLEVTREHVSRLEQAFEMLDKKAQGKKCEAMDGLTKEADGIVEDTEKGTMTRDVGLIMAAQKVEHYEIATYGSLAQLAKTIGNNELADLMGRTLEEEKQADELLTSIAENNINVEATAE